MPDTSPISSHVLTKAFLGYFIVLIFQQSKLWLKEITGLNGSHTACKKAKSWDLIWMGLTPFLPTLESSLTSCPQRKLQPSFPFSSIPEHLWCCSLGWFDLCNMASWFHQRSFLVPYVTVSSAKTAGFLGGFVWLTNSYVALVISITLSHVCRMRKHHCF